MGATNAIAEQLYDKLGRGSSIDMTTIRDALLAAEKRGREEERARAVGVANDVLDSHGSIGFVQTHGWAGLRAVVSAAIRSGS